MQDGRAVDATYAPGSYAAMRRDLQKLQDNTNMQVMTLPKP